MLYYELSYISADNISLNLVKLIVHGGTASTCSKTYLPIKSFKMLLVISENYTQKFKKSIPVFWVY